MVFREGKKKIAKVRFTFFLYEVALVFVFLFVILLVPLFLVPLFSAGNPVLYGILFYGLRALFIFLGVPLILYLTNIIYESQKRKVIIDEDFSPSTGHLKLYKITKKNYKYQILYGLVIFFLVFLPLDFFTYFLIPETIEYQAVVYGFKTTNTYLLSDKYIEFLISAIIIHIAVSITEETLVRGFIAKRGNEYFIKMSAVMISSLYFGLGHFAFFLDPLSRAYPFWFPIVWFIETFIVGIILALFVLRKKWILPVIIAHALNNIVSAHTLWSFWKGINFQVVALFVYIPLFIIGILFVLVCILLVWPLSSVKTALSNGFTEIKSYFKLESPLESPLERSYLVSQHRVEINVRTTGDLLFRIFFDILIGFLIFIMGFLVAI